MKLEEGVELTRIRFSRSPAPSRADVAQLVEQLIRNQQVSGSSPLVGSRKTRHVGLFHFLFGRALLGTKGATGCTTVVRA